MSGSGLAYRFKCPAQDGLQALISFRAFTDLPPTSLKYWHCLRSSKPVEFSFTIIATALTSGLRHCLAAQPGRSFLPVSLSNVSPYCGSSCSVRSYSASSTMKNMHLTYGGQPTQPRKGTLIPATSLQACARSKCSGRGRLME